MRGGGTEETDRREEEGKHQRSAARVVEEEVAEKLVLRGRCCLGTKSDLTSLIIHHERTNWRCLPGTAAP